jgi:NAD(P)-dependent dehydrogenase (short-subunit alcohol dehydrogenase family)
MKRLENKVAIITGGGSGMGAATAALFVKEGARVMVVGRNADKLRKTVQAINHENVSYAVADVSKVEDTQRYVREAVERYGGLDVLVSNAGYEGACQPIHEYPVEEFDQVMATNVRGVWLSLKYAFPEMKKRGGGSIIATSSIAGTHGMPGLSPYCASKHAVAGIVRAAAHDGAPFHIRVNVVCPGLIDNDMAATLIKRMAPGAEAHVKQAIENRIPLKRSGANEEVARMNLFLASSESSYMTGGVYAVDGGITASFM